MKRLLLSLFCGLVYVSNSYASLPEGATPVYSPKVCPGFELNLSGLLLQPNDSDPYYAVVVHPTPPITSPYYAVKAIKPDYTLGYDVGVGYILPRTSSDVKLNWTHLNTHDSDGTRVDLPFFVSPLWEAGPSGNLYREMEARENFLFDTVDLEFGHLVNFFDRCLQSRFFGGVTYAYIKEQRDTNNKGSMANNINFNTFTTTLSRFSSVGPRVGINTTYHLGCYVGIVGQAAGSLLAGSLRSHSTYISSSNLVANVNLPPFGMVTIPVLVDNTQPLAIDRTTRVVPGLDGKVGLSLTYPWGSDSRLVVEAGYRAATYLDAISTIDNNSPPVVSSTVGGVFVESVAQRLRNFTYQGPYLSLSVKI